MIRSRSKWLLVPVLALGAFSYSGHQATAGSEFVENFDGQPTAPQPFHPDNWDIQYHSRDIGTWETPEPMDGHNGGGCEPAPTSHHITTWNDATYLCLDHMMTAVKAEGYGVIYLTPPAMVDFATQGTVHFATSTLLTSVRDWTDVWITPYDQNLVLPLHDWLPDLQGEPARSIHVTRDLGTAKWLIEVVRDHTVTQVATLDEPADLPRSQAIRVNYEIRLTPTGIAFGLPDYNTWTTSTYADLGWTQGVVQFGHHSYNPTKADPVPGGYANSWSWDNFRISPAVPFSITHASPRILMGNGTLTFPAAPIGARLRFSGICTIEINTGSGWQAAVRQSEEKHVPEHFSSYFIAIPTGTTSAQIRFSADDWYSGFPCAVKDPTVWSTDAAAPPIVTTVTTVPVTTVPVTTVPVTTTTTTIAAPPVTTTAPAAPITTPTTTSEPPVSPTVETTVAPTVTPTDTTRPHRPARRRRSLRVFTAAMSRSVVTSAAK